MADTLFLLSNAKSTPKTKVKTEAKPDAPVPVPIVKKSMSFPPKSDPELRPDVKRKAKSDRVLKVPKVEEHPKQAFGCKGQPVFKIGFDKYVTVRKDPDLKFIIGEWIRTSHIEWLETSKQIALNLEQFNKLSGLMLVGTRRLG